MKKFSKLLNKRAAYQTYRVPSQFYFFKKWLYTLCSHRLEIAQICWKFFTIIVLGLWKYDLCGWFFYLFFFEICKINRYFYKCYKTCFIKSFYKFFKNLGTYEWKISSIQPHFSDSLVFCFVFSLPSETPHRPWHRPYGFKAFVPAPRTVAWHGRHVFSTSEKYELFLFRYCPN